MSYNGSGTFVINSAGTPYVSGTVISSTAANALNSDLATGLTTAITKDGQTTPTANIPLGGFKITNLGAGTVASDAARLSQVQNSTTTTLIAITGTDTITGTVSPTLTAYSTGQVFSFVVAATNTGAVTLNVDSIGVKAVTRTGAVALVAGDMVTGQVAVVEYDGTRFQLINGNSFTNLKVSGTLGVTGVTTIAAGTALLPALTTTGDTNTGVWFPAADTIAASTGGTERVRVTSGGNFGIACTPTRRLSVQYDFAKTDITSRAIAVFKSNDASNANEMLISCTGAATQASRVWDIQTGEDGVSNAGIIAFQSQGGNVTIGTTINTDTSGVGVKLRSTGNQSAFVNTADTSAVNNLLMYSTGAAAYRFYVDWSGTVHATNTSIAAMSDITLKENIVDIETGLLEVMALQPRRFDWKNGDGLNIAGFIAQEVEKVLPDLVIDSQYNETETKKSLLMGMMIPTMVKAIQEQQAIIESLTARITALETA